MIIKVRIIDLKNLALQNFHYLSSRKRKSSNLALERKSLATLLYKIIQKLVQAPHSKDKADK